MSFEAAERIADAVLYEGYLLYPYRASAPKNRIRWPFGIIAPRAFSEATDSDPWWAQTECLVEPRGDAALDLRLRFLQIQPHHGADTWVGPYDAVDGIVSTGNVGADPRVRPDAWDQGIARTHDLSDIAIADLVGTERIVPIRAGDGDDIDACMRLSAEPQGRFVKVRVRIENTTAWNAADSTGADRAHAMRRALVSAHLLLHVRNGAFVSLLEPQPDAADAAASCANVRTWPVLVGEPGRRDLMLSSPIILYDYPAVAPESPQELCDGTEIDEILALRVMTLTDEEKRQARATDDRARAIIDRTDAMPHDVLERLHGVIRELRPVNSVDAWETLLNPPGAPSPQDDAVEIGGVRVTKGSRVTVKPKRRADPIDMFVQDRMARVEAVYRDLEGATHVAVVLDDDPSGDLHAWYGRYLYYGPEELEPLA